MSGSPYNNQNYDKELSGRYGDESPKFNQPDLQHTGLRRLPPDEHLTIILHEEDRKLIQDWRRECFYYKVVPLVGASYSYLYFAKKSRSVLPYVACGLASICFGIVSSVGGLRKKILESKLETPFVQMAKSRISRQMQPRGAAMQSTPTTQEGSYGDGYELTTDWTDQNHDSLDISEPAPRYDVYGQPAYPSFSRDQPFSSNYPESDQYSRNPVEEDSEKTNPKTVRYDELRAKNRGLIR